VNWRGAIPVGLTALGCALIWLGYDHMRELPGIWRDLRYVVLGCGVFALLSLFERLAAWLQSLAAGRSGSDEDNG